MLSSPQASNFLAVVTFVVLFWGYLHCVMWGWILGCEHSMGSFVGDLFNVSQVGCVFVGCVFELSRVGGEQGLYEQTPPGRLPTVVLEAYRRSDPSAAQEHQDGSDSVIVID